MYSAAAAVFVVLIASVQFGEAITVATGQVVSKTGSSPKDTISLNVNTIVSLANQAAAAGAALVTFPEFALQGDFQFTKCASPSDTSAYSEALPAVGSLLDCSSQNAASQIGCSSAARTVFISYNTVEAGANGTFFNTQVVVNNGVLIARYRKLNVFYKDCFNTPTQELVTFVVQNTTFGIFTCFDILFDHPKMDLVHAGVKYFSYSSAIPLVGAEVVRIFSALNHVDVVSSNADPGQSEVVVAGSAVAKAPSSGDSIAVAVI